MDENRLYNILIGISILAIIVVAIFIFSTPVKEPFTELYFEDFKNLPKSINLDQEYFFTFTINNKEGQGKNYPTTVLLELDGNIQLISSQEIYLENENTKSVALPFKIKQNFTKGRVIVEIPDHKIHFWVNQK